jgi:hypothetical protein
METPGPARTSSGVTKKFMARLEQLNPWEAAAVGILKQPQTLTAAAVVLVRHHSALPIVVFAFVAFAVLSTATVGLIFLYFARRSREAEAQLSDLRDRLAPVRPQLLDSSPERQIPLPPHDACHRPGTTPMVVSQDMSAKTIGPYFLSSEVTMPEKMTEKTASMPRPEPCRADGGGGQGPPNEPPAITQPLCPRCLRLRPADRFRA